MKSRNLVLGALAIAVAVTGTAVVQAQDELPPINAYRKAFMGGFINHFLALRAIIMGADGLVEHAVVHARAIHGQGQRITEIFPEGSEHPESRALPAVWEQWDTFAERAADFERAAADLVEAAESQDLQRIQAAFAATGQACTACHDTFRRPQ